MMFISYVLLGSLVFSIESFSPTQCWRQGFEPNSPITKLHLKANADEPPVERIRGAVFQGPAQSNEQSKNPLEILTEVADSLRVASMHGVDVVIFPELYLSGGPNGAKRAIDRESYELNIVGNMCGELNVACIIGYAESVHESELKNNRDEPHGEKRAFNSIAAFHADGSRAGNYRSVSPFDDEMRKGHPVVEFIPTAMHLPNRQTLPIEEGRRKIKVGMMCGNDVLFPEHCRHLVRSGAQVIFASTSFRNNVNDLRMVKCVIPCRAMENQVPFLFANFVETGLKEFDFIGSSAIVSQDGGYLVCGHREEDDDMPSDCGYLLSCEVGTLYAADIDITLSSPGAQEIISEVDRFGTIKQSMDQWDLTPRMPDNDGTRRSKQFKGHSAAGFGRESRKKGGAKRVK